MADQAQQATKGATGGAEGAVNTATSGILSKIEGWGSWVAGKGMGIVDSIFPPEKRSAFLAKIQAFMLKNPKLSTFLGMNIALTGIPMGLFILFTIAVAIFALIVGLLLGLLAAVLFTLFMVGMALTVVLPTIFFTTMSATFLFLWGLGGYYILKWANGDDKGGKDGKPSPAIGEMLNNITGGRLTGFMDAAKGERAKGDISGYNDTHNPPKTEQNGKSAGADKQGHANGKPAGGEKHGQANGAPAEAQKKVGDTANQAQKHVNTATKTAQVDGVQKKAANTTGTVKGGLSGATGLG